MDELQELYQQVIIDHNHNPRNFHEIEHPSHSAKGHNPLCGDKLDIFFIIKDDIISEVSFTGSGCAISKASSSLMTEALLGKTVIEAQELFDLVHNMVTNGKTDAEGIGKLAVLSGVHKFPVRVKCAILPWHTMKYALVKNTQTAITE
ncbi:MAG: SUF system NifU family Fe-S cluster assembly protein [Candidatus Marinimicrobia bacterium]|nr:SUF system NifU family Fe-S cluster assembly protein [Candidatus Neomarinimicrobiota bacterium]